MALRKDSNPPAQTPPGYYAADNVQTPYPAPQGAPLSDGEVLGLPTWAVIAGAAVAGYFVAKKKVI